MGVAIILGETGRLINWLIAGGGCHQSTLLPVGFLQSGLTRGDGSFVFRFYEAAVRDLPQPATWSHSPRRSWRHASDRSAQETDAHREVTTEK